MPVLFAYIFSFFFLAPVHHFPPAGDTDLNLHLNSVYKRYLDEESLKKNILRYTFDRKMDIKESDEDGTLKKQRKILQRVYQLNAKESRSQLISNSKWEDGKWEDVKPEENKGDHKERKMKFEFGDIFSPAGRKDYSFELIRQDAETVVIGVKPKKPDTDKFKGKFWFDAKNYCLVKAELQPSDLRMGLKSLNTYIDLKQINGVTYPVKIINKIYVSVFLIYTGKIDQVIYYDNYKFDVDDKSFDEVYSKLK